MANHWNQYVIRVADGEWTSWKEFCKQNHIKVADLIRSAVRVYIANPDFVNGIVRSVNNSVDIRPVVDEIGKLTQKVEDLENRFTPLSPEKDFAHPIAKSQIAEAVLKIKQRARSSDTTVERLREQVIKNNPLLAPSLFASATCPISLLDEVLAELEGKKVLQRADGGIIKFVVTNDA